MDPPGYNLVSLIANMGFCSPFGRSPRRTASQQPLLRRQDSSSPASPSTTTTSQSTSNNDIANTSSDQNDTDTSESIPTSPNTEPDAEAWIQYRGYKSKAAKPALCKWHEICWQYQYTRSARDFFQNIWQKYELEGRDGDEGSDVTMEA